jgi:hypothetical protein
MSAGAGVAHVRRVPSSVLAEDEWDAHVEAVLETALERWRDNRDPGILLEMLGPVIAAIGRRGAL